MLLALTLLLPMLLPASVRADKPILLLSQDHGTYGANCNARLMAMGSGFPEGAGVALFALKEPGLPLKLENIRTALATVVVREGRFVNGFVGLDLLLCGKNDTAGEFVMVSRALHASRTYCFAIDRFCIAIV